MERNVNVLEGCEREARIHLNQVDLKPHYELAYQQAQQNITLPGFRKGKVPIPTIRQKFGRDIENDALETIADAEFRKLVQDEKHRVVGNPALTDIQKSADGVAFTIRFEVMPEIELGQYRDLTVNRPIREVTEEDIDNEINRIALRAATFEPGEEMDSTMYIATLMLHQLDAETSMPIIGAEAREERVFLDDDNVDMHLRNSLQGKKVGDSFTYVAETQDDSQQPPSYRVSVTDIQKVVPAEFTNEFVQTITGGKFTTTEEVREDIRQQISEYFVNSAEDSVRNSLIDQIVQAHTFEVPHSLVHAVMHQLFDDFKKRNEGQPGIENVTAHDMEAELLPTAQRLAKWEMLRDKIIEAENIELNDEDISVNASRYGVTEDQLRIAMRQNRQLSDQLLADKAVRTIVDYAVINDVNVGADQMLP